MSHVFINYLYMNDEIHIGKMIHEKMEEERRSADWLAGKLSCTCANIYKIFCKANIDSFRLIQIGRALNYDFFNRISVILNKKND